MAKINSACVSHNNGHQCQNGGREICLTCTKIFKQKTKQNQRQKILQKDKAATDAMSTHGAVPSTSFTDNHFHFIFSNVILAAIAAFENQINYYLISSHRINCELEKIVNFVFWFATVSIQHIKLNRNIKQYSMYIVHVHEWHSYTSVVGIIRRRLPPIYIMCKLNGAIVLTVILCKINLVIKLISHLFLNRFYSISSKRDHFSPPPLPLPIIQDRLLVVRGCTINWIQNGFSRKSHFIRCKSKTI